jgi:hypothetical protein
MGPLKASPEDVKGLPFGEPRNHNSTWKRGSQQKSPTPAP